MTSTEDKRLSVTKSLPVVKRSRIFRSKPMRKETKKTKEMDNIKRDTAKTKETDNTYETEKRNEPDKTKQMEDSKGETDSGQETDEIKIDTVKTKAPEHRIRKATVLIQKYIAGSANLTVTETKTKSSAEGEATKLPTPQSPQDSESETESTKSETATENIKSETASERTESKAPIESTKPAATPKGTMVRPQKRKLVQPKETNSSVEEKARKIQRKAVYLKHKNILLDIELKQIQIALYRAKYPALQSLVPQRTSQQFVNVLRGMVTENHNEDSTRRQTGESTQKETEEDSSQENKKEESEGETDE